MARLVCDGVACSAAEVADDRRQRARGLLGRDGIEGGLLLPKVRGVHTLGMRFPLDVAFLDADGTVLDTVTMRPGASAAPADEPAVLEAEAGAFERWGVQVGSTVRVEEE